MSDLHKLQDEALSAFSTGDWLTATRLYAALEKAAPREATWSIRLAECLRKQGKRDEAVKALTRALTVYLRSNARNKAVAVCKLILQIDRHNQQAPQVLELLRDTRDREAEPDPEPSLGATPSPVHTAVDSEAYAVPASMRKAERGSRTREPAAAPEAAAPATTSRAIPRVVLPRTPFLSAMQPHQLRMVNERSHLLEVEAGQILFALGEPANALYLVASGSIAMLLPQEIMRLDRGDFFGEEVAVLPGQPRLATLRANEASQVLVLEPDLVADLLAETPALLDILSESLCERLLAIVMHTSPVLASVPAGERRALVDRFRLVAADKGTAILRPDQPDATMGLLLAGQAEACIDGNLTEPIDPGGVFGEIPLVTECQFGTSVVAKDKCFFLELPPGELEPLGHRYPEVLAYLRALADHRVERLRQVAASGLSSSGSLALPPRALLAHRDPSALGSYARAFADTHFIVDYARDAESALMLLGNERFDVVICDVDWLAHAGDDPLGDIRRHDVDVPIILTTRNAALDMSDAAASHGVVRSFAEPFAVEDLVGTAVRAARFHRLTLLQRDAAARLDSSGEWMGDRAGLELHFGHALAHVWMAFQPIISASARNVFAFEALLRASEGLLRSPAALLRAAERLRRVHDVGRIARDRVAAAAQLGDPPLLFVNVHHQDLLDPHLLDPRAALSSLAPRVILEISHHTPLDDLADLRGRLRTLRELGYRFAIDDLGAGCAGVATLAQLEPDIAKLDISLIRRVDGDSVKQALIASMLESCREMGIAAICEGVETERERDTLLRLGADLMQGYLFARPGPPFPTVDLETLSRTR